METDRPNNHLYIISLKKFEIFLSCPLELRAENYHLSICVMFIQPGTICLLANTLSFASKFYVFNALLAFLENFV